MPIMALHDDLKWLLGKWFIKKHGVSPKVFPLGLRRFPDERGMLKYMNRCSRVQSYFKSFALPNNVRYFYGINAF